MLIWKGWGLLGLPALVVSCIFFSFVFGFGITVREDGPLIGWTIMVVAFGLWRLGRRLNRARVYPDIPHSFFSFPLQWYAVLLFLSGATFTVATLRAPSTRPHSSGSQAAKRSPEGPPSPAAVDAAPVRAD